MARKKIPLTIHTEIQKKKNREIAYPFNFSENFRRTISPNNQKTYENELSVISKEARIATESLVVCETQYAIQAMPVFLEKTHVILTMIHHYPIVLIEKNLIGQKIKGVKVFLIWTGYLLYIKPVIAIKEENPIEENT